MLLNAQPITAPVMHHMYARMGYMKLKVLAPFFQIVGKMIETVLRVVICLPVPAKLEWDRRTQLYVASMAFYT